MNIEYPSKPIKCMNIESYPTLSNNWTFTKDKLEKLNKELNEAITNPKVSIVAAGSYGRMEANRSSDLDYILLCDGELKDGEELIIRDVVELLLKNNDIPKPNPGGIFSKFFIVDSFLENIGSREDTIDSLGQRLLLLLESRPIYNEKVYKKVVKKIFNKYLTDISNHNEKEALFLLNDLIKYFRSICVNYQYSAWKEEEKWALRNIKLRHSRLVLYAGMLLIILNASKYDDARKVKYIIDSANYTPLENISRVYYDNGVKSLDRILSSYEVFLRKISNPGTRDCLNVEIDCRYESPHYLEMKVCADNLRSELVRFILQMRSHWTERIFEYMIL